MVVLVQRVIRMEWEIFVSISNTPSEGLSKFSMIHLLPSSSLRGGFFVRILSGLGRLPGTGDLPLLDWESERVGGTAAPARSVGFL